MGGVWPQNIDVDKCQLGHQVPLLMVFRFFKQRFDQWAAELVAAGQEMPSYDAAAVRRSFSFRCYSQL